MSILKAVDVAIDWISGLSYIILVGSVIALMMTKLFLELINATAGVTI